MLKSNGAEASKDHCTACPASSVPQASTNLPGVIGVPCWKRDWLSHPMSTRGPADTAVAAKARSVTVYLPASLTALNFTLSPGLSVSRMDLSRTWKTMVMAGMSRNEACGQPSPWLPTAGRPGLWVLCMPLHARRGAT